jgi:hypothetical protein
MQLEIESEAIKRENDKNNVKFNLDFSKFKRRPKRDFHQMEIRKMLLIIFKQ